MAKFSKTCMLGCGLLLGLGAGSAQAAKVQIIYAFAGQGDGANPEGGLFRDKAGNLYGTTLNGGPNNSGTAFQLQPNGMYQWLFRFGQTLVDYGYHPYAGLAVDKTGNWYATLSQGGVSNDGGVAKFDANMVNVWQHDFAGGSGDGATPYAGVILDTTYKTGAVYGTTLYGGPNNLGVIFRIASDGSEIILHGFNGICCGQNDGSFPYGALVEDKNGNLYGTTSNGGSASDMGTVFKFALNGGTYTVIHAFSGGSDGANPIAGLILEAAGNLYGTTSKGGPDGLGTLFRVAPDGTEVILHGFHGICCGQSDGSFPFGGLVEDANGNLYGTTVNGGSASDEGTIFRFALNGGSYTVLHAFTGGSDGSHPVDTLFYKKGRLSSTLYGTTVNGGASDLGTVFKMKIK